MAVPTFPIQLDQIEFGPINLRPFELTDYEDFCAYRCRPDVARYVPWAADDREGARTALEKRSANRSLEQPGDTVQPAIVDTTSGVVIGETMLAWSADKHETAELGYALHPDDHGHGIAGAAAAEMLRIGFAELGLHRIFGGCDARNGPSAVLMTRLGMRQEAHFRDYDFIKGEWCDELIFAILADEWRATHPE